MDAVPLFFGVLRAAELAVQKWGLDVWVDLAKGSMVNLSACDRCVAAADAEPRENTPGDKRLNLKHKRFLYLELKSYTSSLEIQNTLPCIGDGLESM